MNSSLQFLLASAPRKKVYKAIADGLQGLHEEQARIGREYLPNFIIIGAAKSATTTLATILPRHPDIFISKPKEPKFFGRRYDKGWKWYRKMFRPGRSYPLRGEASTMYASSLASFRYSPALMHRYLPGLKIIYIVRHPLDRLVSQWRHLKGRHPNFVDFNRFLAKRHAAKLLIGCSSYYARINSYRKYFHDDQIHCLTFEDLLAEPATELARLLRFLGAPVQPQLLLNQGKLPKVNEAGQKGRTLVQAPQLSSRLRSRVVRELQPDSEAFLAYIGKPKNYWDWYH
ncbi:MAG: sulfotransferase [Cyanobacteria bacterium J06638_7]